MLQLMLTGIANLLAFFSVTISTNNEISLLTSVFLFSTSIGLEALSLWENEERCNSRFINASFYTLTLVFILGYLFSILGYAEFIDFSISFCNINNKPQIIMSIPKNSLLPHFAIVCDIFIYLYGIITIVIPFVLAIRINSLKNIRKRNYNLTKGFFEK